MLRCLLPILCLGACAEVALPYNQEWDPPTNPTAAAPEGADTAAKLVWMLLEGEDGRLPLVHWVSEGPCLEGVGDPSKCHTGFYHYFPETDTHEVWCLVMPKLRQSAIIHELTHAALQDTEGDPDAPHAGPRWGEIPEVRQKLIDVGAY